MPPVVRLQRRNPIARRYDAESPAIAIDKMLLRAVDEPSMINERRMDMTVVATIVATGIDVRGLTCEAQTVSSRLVRIDSKSFSTVASSYHR